MLINKPLLVNEWNKVFSESIVPSIVEDSSSVDELFNNYLSLVVTSRTCALREDICLIDKIGHKYYIHYVSNNAVDRIELDVRSKRKLFSFISNYPTVITNNFPLQDNFQNKKTILRYELIRNIFTSNNTHYFSTELPFPVNDYNVFFTEDFYNLLTSNTTRFNLLKFSSMLLSNLEVGVTIDEFILKPNINISRYGRWYWSNTENIQTSLRVRNRFYSKIRKYGRVLNVDFISAEPNLLSKLYNSELMKKLVRYRTLMKKSQPEISDMIKNLLNVYIHSNDSPTEAFKKFKNRHDPGKIKSELGIDVFEILSCLQDDFICYNKYIIDSYKTNLCVEEFNRRIVNPGIFTDSEREVIKEHRKFLQGHVHDHVLELARLLNEDLNILPIFTIHDSLSYFIPSGLDLDDIKSSLSKNVKKLGIPVEIEIIT